LKKPVDIARTYLSGRTVWTISSSYFELNRIRDSRTRWLGLQRDDDTEIAPLPQDTMGLRVRHQPCATPSLVLGHDFQ